MRNPVAQVRKWFALRKQRRSSGWRKARQQHIATESWCRACGRTSSLEVHHVVPFHQSPELELEPSNLITLCENWGVQCHLKLGHFGNWKTINPDIRAFAHKPKPQP